MGSRSSRDGNGQRFGVVLQQSGDPFLAIGLVQASSDDARIVQIGSEIVLKTRPGVHAGPEVFMLLISRGSAQ